MAHKTLHEIIHDNGTKVIPAGTVVSDMPKGLVDELLPIGAIEVIPTKVAKNEVSSEAKD